MKRYNALVSVAAFATAATLGMSAAPASAASPDTIWNTNTTLCAVPYGGSDSDGAFIVQYKCNTDPTMLWYTSHDSNGFSTIVNNSTHKCLTVYGGSTDPGTYVTQYKCNNSDAQKWDVNVGGAGDIWLDDGYDDACLTVTGGSGENNAKLSIWNCNGLNAFENWEFYG
ncbi:Ricin-type beta-trefoil lectin domain-containing protein [Actinacidiphila yanglinensis]|uniref:Ricin-type beta-trefoil lectin domain-containing protein n=1 Tax=Actinacidiphila yanglinensis TaxID=310779 RepID=A0A1H6AWK2_9ACTN|nr:RICIN domain-containing protein [Actinacidiphila yanglinensis]SEG52447.1 Ricin-type beta-trefoil lectin domain-containing protein [Actinacidiphila yanglinensis]